MIAIVDYGVGNLFSLKSSVLALGFSAEVTNDESLIRSADHVILPGVGAFGDAMDKLRKSGMDQVVKAEAAAGKPLLGICVGMQMLFDMDYEYGEHGGLGLIRGEVKTISPVIEEGLKVPEIGWNALSYVRGSRLYEGVPEGSHVYFVHSYSAFGCDESLTARAWYGAWLTASVEEGNVYGTQFHPEKSGPVGLKILKNFCSL